MFDVIIYNLLNTNRIETKANYCSLRSEEEGAITLLANHMNCAGTIAKDSQIKVDFADKNLKEGERIYKADSGIFRFDSKENTLYIFFEEKAGDR